MVDKAKVEQAIRLLLEGIGENPDREGLKDTPDRIARMCTEIYGGLDEEADQHLLKQFQVENNEMVLEKDHVRTSSDAILRQGTHCLYPEWQSNRSQQARPYCRRLCKKTADPGTTDCSDRRCPGSCS